MSSVMGYVHIDQQAPMVLDVGPMVNNKWDRVNTMNLHLGPMGGKAKYHGAGVSVHGTYIH